jgi:peptidoglycan/xylan/chitin deacetylase (PgdA/CDA1 family)
MLKSTLINFFEACGILRISRYANRYHPMILMYHRILNDPMVPGISPEIFAQHLNYLKKHFRVVAMNQMVDELQSNTIQPYTVAITFDDGHEDFYTNAWPLLQQHKLPASLYITTGFIDKQCWLWPDLLRYLVINTPCNTAYITGIGQLSFNKEQALNTWNTIGDYCLTLDALKRDKFLTELSTQLYLQIPAQPQAPFAPLSWDQLRAMHAQGLDVGSHSVSHPILSQLTEADLISELSVSRQRIQYELGTPPTGTCYPNGMAPDVSEQVEKHASHCYQYGLVAYPAAVSAQKLMHLGRWAAPNKISRFKQVLNSFSRNDNQSGEYR